MNTSVAVTFGFIVLARITDMTMDTIRTAAVVQGRRAFAASLGFFQALIYILAIAKVLLNMLLYVEVSRKRAPKLIHDAGKIDKDCFCVVNDVRTAGFANRSVTD